MAQYKLIIRFKKVQPDRSYYNSHQERIKGLFSRTRAFLHRITPFTISCARNAIFSALKTSFIPRIKLEGARLVDLPDGMEITEMGSKEKIFQEEAELKEFLTGSLKGGIEKSPEKFTEKLHAIKNKISDKIHEATLASFYKLGIFIEWEVKEIEISNVA